MSARINRMQAGFFLVLLIAVSLAFLGLIQDFLLPLFWATVLAIIFRPLHERYVHLLRGREGLAAGLGVLTIILVVLLPIFLVGLAVVSEAQALYARVVSGELAVQEAVEYVERQIPAAQQFMQQFGIDTAQLRDQIAGAAAAVSQGVASRVLVYGQNALTFTVQFFLMLYLLYFFLRDGDRLVERLIRVLPFGDARERRLLGRFADVSRATLKGTLIVAAVQGTLGGLFFWMLGIEGAVFWGVVMTLLSLLPAIGTALVWAPAALILFFTGHPIKALILVIAGTVVIGLVDNLLRPILVGRDAKMPDYLVLLATIGGITLFGLSGFIIGPVLAALFLTTWNIFAEDFSHLDEPGAEPLLVAPDARTEAAVAKVYTPDEADTMQ